MRQSKRRQTIQSITGADIAVGLAKSMTDDYLLTDSLLNQKTDRKEIDTSYTSQVDNDENSNSC